MRRRKNHSRRADAALCATTLKERLLQRFDQIVRRHSFDGDDTRAARLRHGNETAIHQHAVQQNGTRTALAFTAPFFRARQSQLVPQHVQQSLHRISEHVLRLAVDSERNLALRARSWRKIHAVPCIEEKTSCSGEARRTASNKSSGSSGMEQKRIPVASSTAFTIAGAGPSIGNSPMPLAPCAPCTLPSSSKNTRIGGRSTEVAIM